MSALLSTSGPQAWNFDDTVNILILAHVSTPARVMRTQRQKLSIDPYYNSPPRDEIADTSRDSSPGPSPCFSFSPSTDMSSTDSRTPTSADSEWRLCFVLCLYNFESSDPDHLAFRKNEILEIVKKEDSGWWAALRDDRIGWVPSAFVAPLSNEMAGNLRNVREELRIAEYNAERLYYAAPVTDIAQIFDSTPSPSSAHGHPQDEWYPFVEPGGKIPFKPFVTASGLVTDIPDDVVPLSGIEPHSPPRSESLDGFSTDSEPEAPPDYSSSTTQPMTYPPSPATPMPHPVRPKIAPLLIDKPTPPTPRPSGATPVRSPLTRSRSDSAPSTLAVHRHDRRRPIMLNDFSSLSRLSVSIDSRDPAEVDSFDMPDLYKPLPGSPTTRRNDKVKQLTGDDDAQAFHNAKQALAKLPWYLQPSYSTEDIKLEYDGSVRAGTVPALIERLTVDPLKMTQELSYRHAFLTTFRTFTTADEVFDLLIERYQMDHPAGLTTEEFEEWKNRKLRPIQTRVLKIFSMWFEEHGLRQDDPHIVPRLREFLILVVSPPPLALTAKLMLQSLDRVATPLVQTPVVAAATPSRRRKSTRQHKNELLRQDPADLAQQLTLSEHILYSKIRPQECLNWARTQKDESVQNLTAFCATHDKLAAWVKLSVLSNDGLGKRADTVDFWIRVAEKCRAMSNFSSMSAITAALQSVEIARLYLTWAHVGRHAQMETLARLNEPSQNFSAYRTLLQSVDGPCIPFIGIFLTDIVHIHDQLRDNITYPSGITSTAANSSGSTSSSPPKLQCPLLINFMKRQKWYDAVNAIVRFQAKSYAIVENPPTMFFIKDQLTQSSLKESGTFWSRSQELQATEAAHADIRKGLEAAGF